VSAAIPHMPRGARRRALGVLALLLGVGVAVGLALLALRENINLFYSPSEVAAGKAPMGRVVRVGGLVQAGSVRRAAEGLDVEFVLTDGAATVTVRYRGILPDLFREGQGIVAQGKLEPGGVLVAEQVLAKHDENYMPPEVASALREAHERAVGGAAASAPAGGGGR